MAKKENNTKDLENMIRNVRNAASVMRQEWMTKLIDQGSRDINYSCGYPDNISSQEYHNIYEREGVASRVVDVFPEECWLKYPYIYETEDENKTEFEMKLEEIDDKFHLFHYMSRIDKLSGVGAFGILLIGINDGKELYEPVDNIDETGEPFGTPTEKKLIYLRTFDESVVTVQTTQTDVTNPRYGLPVLYNIAFIDNGQSFNRQVHWTRIIHVADNREMSEIYGIPRMMKVYNRLLDIRKVLSGSGEMFWKGAFPGFSFEVAQDETGAELDAESLRAEFDSYMNGLQRYLALSGVTAKSLAPQVADPRGHLEAQLDSICIALKIPKRIFVGSERGELSSSQDSITWNGRLMKRQNDYITPMLVRPIIDRLIQMNVLPFIESYTVEWEDLNKKTSKDKAEEARIWAETFSKYVGGDVTNAIPLAEFLNIFARLSSDEVTQILDSLQEFLKEEELSEEEEMEFTIEQGNVEEEVV